MTRNCKPTYTPEAEIFETLSEVSEIRDTDRGTDSRSAQSTFTVRSFCTECKTMRFMCYGKTGGYLSGMMPDSFQTIFVLKLLKSISLAKVLTLFAFFASNISLLVNTAQPFVLRKKHSNYRVIGESIWTVSLNLYKIQIIVL